MIEKIIKLFSSKPNTPKAFFMLGLYWGIPILIGYLTSSFWNGFVVYFVFMQIFWFFDGPIKKL